MYKYSYVCHMETILDVSKLDKVAYVLKTIAHPIRIGIVELLTHYDKMSVNEMCERLDSEQSLISHHLSVMKSKGILICEREGKQVFYSLRLMEVTKVIHCIENCDMDRLN